MSSDCALRARRGLPCWSLALLAAGLFLFAWNSTAAAQNGLADVVAVAEDWELKVATPDADNDAPQVSCVISPTGDLGSLHASLLLNHQTLPDYTPGGIQLQVWNGESPQSNRKFPNGAVMAQTGETVTWTQTMTLDGGTLTFEVVGGSSATWGNFGNEGYLKASAATTLANLNGYTPTVTVQHSGVDFAGNRVTSLTLKKVRRLLSTGQVIEDATPRVVHEQTAP